jgi:hypothetical protein
VADPTPVLAALRQAIDLCVLLSPPGYGADLARHRERVSQLADLVDSVRRKKPAKALLVPARKRIEPLKSLAGAHFQRERAEIVALLQAACAELERGLRSAPPELLAHLRAIAVTDLEFASLERDAHEAWRALHGNAFKAAVVMAVAVLEGLLQQACQRLGAGYTEARARLFKSDGRAASPANVAIDDALAILREAGALTSAIGHVARGVKELRNFVHPDVQRRSTLKVGAPHALLALQALLTIAQDLARPRSRGAT